MNQTYKAAVGGTKRPTKLAVDYAATDEEKQYAKFRIDPPGSSHSVLITALHPVEKFNRGS